MATSMGATQVCVFALVLLGASGLASAQCGAKNMWPVCSQETPCPNDGTYYYCQAGTAANGCRPIGQGPFPGQDCCAQCLTNALPTFDNCTTNPPCPRDNTTYYWCSQGKAYNGCRSIELGPFPLADCDAQCTFIAPPPIQSCNDTTPCPKDGSVYYYCMSGKAINGCRPQAQGPFLDIDCDSQCSWSSPSSRKLLKQH